jgi:macrolide-specific efflux system membrane fusion protein
MNKNITFTQTNVIPKLKKVVSSPKKIGLLMITLIILGLVGDKFVFSKNTKPQYQTALVSKGMIISTISESGNVSSPSQVNISSTTDGIIEDIYVKNGDIVNAGDRLFQVKSTATPQEKASAYATYLNALNSNQTAQQNKLSLQAQLETARKTVLDAQTAVDQMNTNRSNSYNNPATKQPYTQNEIDSINSSLTSARQNFTVNETKYNQVGTSISAASSSQAAAWLAYQATQDSIVTAPISGSIANLSAVIGSNVSATNGNNTSTSSTSTSSTTTSSPVLVIGNFSSLFIKSQVSEVDIPKLKVGQKVTITLDAFADKTFVGQVNSIDTIGTSTSGVVTYTIYIGFLDPPSDIQPGMSASATIQINRKDDVLKIPTTAIQTRNGTSTVSILKNGKITPATVEIGISSDTETEITSGLNENDMVVTSTLSSTSNTRTSQTTSPFGGLNRGGFGGAVGGAAGGGNFRGGGGGRN